jgi:branched-chain amino acid transport system substrate-binding protein
MMRISRRGAIGAGTVLAVAGQVRAQGVAPPPQGAPLTIGAIFPLSGPLAPLGDESFRGLEMAVEERNAAGGLSGRPLRLVRADATDDTTAITEARRLTSGSDRAAAIFGSFVSTVALPASQVAELAGVPFFELGAKSDALLDRGFRLVFRASPRAADYAAATLTAVTDILAPALGAAPPSLRLAIAHEDAASGQSVGAAQEAGARAAGLTLVERVAYGERPADLGAVVQRLRGLATDVVLHSGAPGDEVLLFRAMREAAWRPRMVVGVAGGYGVAETARLVGDGFLGAISADHTPFAVDERFAPGAGAFAEAYLRRYGAAPRAGNSLAAFVGARIFLDGLARAGGTERDRIRAAIQALDQPEGTTPAGWGARFDERGQNQRARPVICQWQAGPRQGGLAGPRQVALLGAPGGIAPVVPRLGV